MRAALLVGMVVVAAVAAMAACGDDGGAAPGEERGPCLEGDTCNAGLTCLSDLCVRQLDGAVDDSDAGEPIDGGAIDAEIDQARAAFDQHIAPILAAHCDSCHAAGAAGAPAFGTGYDAYDAYVSSYGALFGCTLTQSALLTRGEHAAGAAPLFTVPEEVLVRDFLDLYAELTAACASFAGRLPSTGPILLQEGDYTVDMSLLGNGLLGTVLGFTVQQDLGGLLLTDVRMITGTTGVIAVGPVFETCPGGLVIEDEEFRYVHVGAGPSSAVPVGDGSILLQDAALGDRFAVRFAALLPAGGATGAPIDSGGSCLPP